MVIRWLTPSLTNMMRLEEKITIVKISLVSFPRSAEYSLIICGAFMQDRIKFIEVCLQTPLVTRFVHFAYIVGRLADKILLRSDT